MKLAPLWWFVAFILVFESVLLLVPDNQFTRTAQVRYDELGTLKSPDVVIYGDSVADGAINDRVVTEDGFVEGHTFQNYAVPGTTALAAYPLLKRQVAEGKVPKRVVLAYSARSYFTPLPEKHYGRFLPLQAASEAVALGMPAKDYLKSALSKASFTLRYRDELNHILRYGTGGLASFDVVKSPAVGYEQRLTSLTTGRERVTKPLNVQSPRARIFFEVDGVQPAYLKSSLEKFLDLARANDIQVALLEVPIPNYVELNEEFKESYAEFLVWLEKEKSVVILRHEQTLLPGNDFSDGVHLTVDAATDFSRAIKHPLSAWVKSKSEP